MKKYYLIFLVLVFGYCRFDLKKELNQRIQDPMIGTKELEILIVTNRSTESQESCTNQYFLNHPDKIKYLSCNVNVPSRHSIGSLDTSSDSILDRDLYFYSRNFQRLQKEEFFDKIKKDKEKLIFVHGFNVEFEEALFRAAQIKYDLKFQGQIILFTWPAGPEKSGLLNQILLNKTYAINLVNAKNTIPLFKEFINEIYKNTKNSEIELYIIVHSMGHQIVIPSLVQLSKENSIRKKIKELIFNAPDYPVDQFKTEVTLLKNIAERITIYCSPSDNALKVSEQVNGVRRLGQCFLMDGVDVINVGRIDNPALGIAGLGHGYYSSRPILTDLYQLILGLEAPRRLFIIKSNQSTENYILRD